MYINAKQIIDAVSSVALNAEVTGCKVTPAYVSYMLNTSEKHALTMIQNWEGAGSPVSDN